ncbi:MAG: phosphoribosylformylglycinamidine synthase subunit PurS [Phycisphaerales bacterium]|nr:phosphoribosylformylglycinamidine synthase subunit PurS [Phycisphaerales bacterium]MCB9857299.1 phosphoribosylformylglycinamidine synthase subunit PurS [Phycisphaerales bacterium]MCB9862987.1 phosphoribosylformylglycinamidine synthase subunit PurS [Phycisphaerales bacterium]
MTVWRFQVTPKSGEEDPRGRRIRATLADFGVSIVRRVEASRLYLIELDADDSVPPRIADELLTDPVVETCRIAKQGDPLSSPDNGVAFEVYFKPGVMDNAANTTLRALHDMGIPAASVRTGYQYVITPGPTEADRLRIPRLIANDCIEEVHPGVRPITPPPTPPSYRFELRHVAIRSLDDDALRRLSRDGHLFLSLDEMQAIRSHFRSLEREPTDLELETLAQTWSEHCVHKTLKSAYVYRGAPMPGSKSDGDVEIRYDNLLADTIARATKELMAEGRGPECLSVFVDNAGIIGFDGEYGIAFKVETHNHPSAIEPYGGAATGAGGVIRDVLGCGLGAKPVANTDVFCVAHPDWPVDQVPKGVIHPKTVLKGIVSGVRDYGNCMGIPTVNGAVHFDPRYLGNPLVYCGCVGLIPRNRIEKAPQPGDAIVVLGGRTGRDGIHGATFSSAELTDTHEDEFGHAVQIGNPVEEKKVRDVVLFARDYRDVPDAASRCLFSSITDCGAGGLSSAIGEMAEKTGAIVDLDKVPLKYSGLRYDEIWISEAQERMVLSVPKSNVDALLALSANEDVEATVIGEFTNTGKLVVRYNGTTVGELDMHFLHDGIPKREKVAEWQPAPTDTTTTSPSAAVSTTGEPKFSNVSIPPMTNAESPVKLDASQHRDIFKTSPELKAMRDKLQAALSDPTVASKHWIIRQYDHEVQAGSAVKPLVGPGEGPGDAAVVKPRLNSSKGVVLGCGLAPDLADVDPYWMAIAAIDEAVRNCVCVGGDPKNMAILDNFCWPSSDDPHSLGALIRTCQACYDAAKAYGLPFISGKDSLNNVFSMSEGDAAMVQRVVDERYGAYSSRVRRQFARQPGKLGIPHTLLISAISVIDDVYKCIRSAPSVASGERYYVCFAGIVYRNGDDIPLHAAAKLHEAVAKAIRSGLVAAAHDLSDGGLLAALVEMGIGAGCSVDACGGTDIAFSEETNQRGLGYLLAHKVSGGAEGASEVLPGALQLLDREVSAIECTSSSAIGSYGGIGWLFRDGGPAMLLRDGEAVAPLEELRIAWRAPLDW